MEDFFPYGGYDTEKIWFDNLFPFKLNWTQPTTKFFNAHGQNTFEAIESAQYFSQPIFVDLRKETLN